MLYAMERLLSLLFMGFFVSCFGPSVNEESENTVPNVKQKSLTSIYTGLINSFDNASARGVEATSTLPDYFGGAYVKDGKIIVFLTKGSDWHFVNEDLSKRLDLNYVSFLECDYSYAKLMALDKWLFDFFTKDGNKQLLNSLYIDGWSIDKNKNRVVVKLKYCSCFFC